MREVGRLFVARLLFLGSRTTRRTFPRFCQGAACDDARVTVTGSLLMSRDYTVRAKREKGNFSSFTDERCKLSDRKENRHRTLDASLSTDTEDRPANPDRRAGGTPEETVDSAARGPKKSRSLTEYRRRRESLLGVKATSRLF